MYNERGAGRKSNISEQEFSDLMIRYQNGESLSTLALEAGVSKQALSQRMKRYADSMSEQCIDYMVDGVLVSRIAVNVKQQQVRVINYVTELSKTAFGWNEHPNWEDFLRFAEERYLQEQGFDGTSDGHIIFCQETMEQGFEAGAELPRFAFSKREILYAKTDTDGYQMKALSRDRKWFVKSQAMIGGLLMNDPEVEVIASDFCRELGIPHVSQRLCQVVYGGHEYEGVYSANFELDGYTFLSFESLLGQHGLSTKDADFIHLSSVDKLKWCAKKLAEYGQLPYESTLQYMLNLAVIDILVANVDRHTRNFGLFYNCNTGAFSVPLIFDNGMGLFEHDGYRDTYKSFDEAMNTVYVSPYGEDPFDFFVMLEEAFGIRELYPGVADLDISKYQVSPFAAEYLKRVIALWQK